MSLTGGIELAPLITKIKVDLKNFKNNMNDAKSEAVSAANEISSKMSNTAKVGQHMSKVGGALTLGLTVPLVGIGTAAGKMAIDFESSFAKVSTLLDDNITNYDQYKNDILNASSQTKVAVGEFSEAVYESISAGVDQTKAIGFTTEAMKLAKGGFTSGASAVDILTTAINGYNLKAEDSARLSDLLITTQNLGKTTVDELSNSMGRVIPVASSVNFSMEELSASYAQLTKNGIATEESGTYLKQMLSELGKTGSTTDKALRELTGKSFAELKNEGVATSDILRMMRGYAEENGMTLKDMFGSVEAGSAALVLAKGNGEEYDEMLRSMETSAGATQAAFEKMDATPAEKFKGSLNNLKNAGIKLGEAMIPMITKVADVVGVFAEKIAALTPEQAEMILKIGATVAAIGPLLKIGGSLITGVSKLKPLISGTSTAIEKGIPLLGKLGSKFAESGGLVGKFGGWLGNLTKVTPSATSALSSVASSAASVSSASAVATGAGSSLLSVLGGMATTALPWVAGAAAIGTAAYGVYKVLDQDLIPEVDLFKDKTTLAFDEMGNVVGATTVKISEETQKQVQSYMDLSNSAQQESLNMYTGITQITDENVASLTTKVNDMATSIITATNTQRDEVTKGFQEMFTNTTVLTEQEQNEIMEDINNGYNSRIEATNSLRDELTTIYQQISDNGGNITQSQQERIDQIYESMKTNAVLAMSENEAEQNVILNRLSSSNERITAEMVGESIRQMNELKESSIQKAEEKRDALVLEAEKLKTIEGGKYAEKAQAIIEAANAEYDGVVSAADKTRTEGIDKLMSAHSDLAGDIDIETGDIVSNWDKIFGKWNQWQPAKKVAVIETNYTYNGDRNRNPYMDGSHYNGLEYVPFDGYNARLHEGERVLTKKENESYSKSQQRGIGIQGKIVLDVPLSIDGREFAHATKEYTAEELGFGMVR